MFIAVKKHPKVYVQQKAMDNQFLAPVTSNFRINLALVAEISTYSIKETKSRRTLDGEKFDLPINTRVIHMEMSYTHSTQRTEMGSGKKQTVNERYFYRLLFLPEAHDEYLRIRNILDQQTLG